MTTKQRLYRFRSDLKNTSKYTGRFLFFAIRAGFFNVITLYYLVRIKKISLQTYVALVHDLQIMQDVRLGLYLYGTKYTYPEMKRAVRSGDSEAARTQQELLEESFLDGL